MELFTVKFSTRHTHEHDTLVLESLSLRLTSTLPSAGEKFMLPEADGRAMKKSPVGKLLIETEDVNALERTLELIYEWR